MGEIVAIWVKRFRGGPMDAVGEVELTAGRGLRGNANQGGRRQITIIDEGAWSEAVLELGIPVDPRSRRANVMLRGLDLRHSTGKLLRLGSSVIRIFGESRPCHVMDEMQQGLREALKPEWRAGASGEIVESGTIRTGDAAVWLD